MASREKARQRQLGRHTNHPLPPPCATVAPTSHALALFPPPREARRCRSPSSTGTPPCAGQGHRAAQLIHDLPASLPMVGIFPGRAEMLPSRLRWCFGGLKERGLFIKLQPIPRPQVETTAQADWNGDLPLARQLRNHYLKVRRLVLTVKPRLGIPPPSSVSLPLTSGHRPLSPISRPPIPDLRSLTSVLRPPFPRPPTPVSHPPITTESFHSRGVRENPARGGLRFSPRYGAAPFP